MGTPSFAVPSLERTVAAGHDVLAVFTQPDRPKGRGHKDAMPPVKQAALRLGLPVHQPERVRRPEVVEQLRAMAPEAMVVVGYGQIIPKAILDIPPQGIINVHASLLPKYRGAAPIQWAIARGETRTGVTTMRINAGLDTGDMLLKWETAIGPEENAVELGQRLAVCRRGAAGAHARRAPHHRAASRRTIRKLPTRPFSRRKTARSTGSFRRRKSSTAFAASSPGPAATASCAGNACRSGERPLAN